jgi:tetratricopeptide (TPR) repeat protein
MCEDFSAARNESLRLCEQDWIFVLDADERVAPDDMAKLKRLAQGPQDRCYRLVTRNYTNNRDLAEFTACAPNDPYARGFAGWFPSAKVRLFPNHPEAKFTGVVHELVEESLEKLGIRPHEADVPIHHYGQVRGEAEIREKQAKYLKLGHDKIRENPTNAKGFIELGKQYAEVHDHTNAAGAYREALKLEPQNVEALHQLGGMLFMLKRPDEAVKSLNLAVRLDPRSVAAWRNLGVVHADAKRWPDALECFEKAFELDRVLARRSTVYRRRVGRPRPRRRSRGVRTTGAARIAGFN